MANILEQSQVAYTYPRTMENLAFLQELQRNAIASGEDSQTLFKIGWLVEGFTRATYSGKVEYSPADVET